MKSALLIGINYAGEEGELRGCINDVYHIADFLEYRGYKDITIMTDEKHGRRYPSRYNILSAMRRFADRARRGDTLFFHYSGHGNYVRDYSYSEYDNQDETIVPADMDEITDDEIRENLIDRLPRDAKLFAILDCCHSGTALDLRYTYKDGYTRPRRAHGCPRTHCHVAMISGCRDDQTSADALMDSKYQGALTNAFLANYKSGITFENLIARIRKHLKDGDYEQRPQLCTGRQIYLDQAVDL